jgi:hypothetical protein
VRTEMSFACLLAPLSAAASRDRCNSQGTVSQSCTRCRAQQHSSLS